MRSTGRGRRVRDDELNPEADQVGDKPRKTVGLAFGPSRFDAEILALDVASLAKPTVELLHESSVCLGRANGEEANPADVTRRLRLAEARRENQSHNENDREPDPPHTHLGGDCCAGV